MAEQHTTLAKQRFAQWLEEKPSLSDEAIVEFLAGVLEEHEILYEAQTEVYRRQAKHTADATTKLVMLATRVHTVTTDPMELAMQAPGYDLNRTVNRDGTITFELVATP